MSGSHNLQTLAFIGYTTAYPSEHRGSLYLHVHSCGIQGNMWHQIQARLSKISILVLHPNLRTSPKTNTVTTHSLIPPPPSGSASLPPSQQKPASLRFCTKVLCLPGFTVQWSSEYPTRLRVGSAGKRDIAMVRNPPTDLGDVVQALGKPGSDPKTRGNLGTVLSVCGPSSATCMPFQNANLEC
jgi:hypothetical protein